VQYERQGAAATLLLVVTSGVFSVGWAFGATRRLLPFMIVLGSVQVVITIYLGNVLERLSTSFDPRSDPGALKQFLFVDASIASFLLFSGYVLMTEFVRREGIRYYATHTEMRLASEIHRNLVPDVCLTIGDFDFYGRSVPSGEVGADVLDVVEKNGTWFAYVADVSGHGVPASVLMTMVKSAARMRLASAGPENFLGKMNEVLGPLSAPAMFATLACLSYCGSGDLEFSAAGHGPVLHYRSRLRTVEKHSLLNFPVALFKGSIQFQTSRIECEPGDILGLITDGVTEVFNRSDEELGFLPLEAVFTEQPERRSLQEIAESLHERARRHGKQTDDQTILLIRRRCPSSKTSQCTTA